MLQPRQLSSTSRPSISIVTDVTCASFSSFKGCTGRLTRYRERMTRTLRVARLCSWCLIQFDSNRRCCYRCRYFLPIFKPTRTATPHLISFPFAMQAALFLNGLVLLKSSKMGTGRDLAGCWPRVLRISRLFCLLIVGERSKTARATALGFSSPRCLSHAYPTKRHGTCRAYPRYAWLGSLRQNLRLGLTAWTTLPTTITNGEHLGHENTIISTTPHHRPIYIFAKTGGRVRSAALSNTAVTDLETLVYCVPLQDCRFLAQRQYFVATLYL
jgi:hypothetical protein